MIASLGRVGSRPKVLEAIAGQVVVEVGDPASITDDERIAIVAQWSESPVMTRSLRTYLSQFVENGYRVVLVSSSPSSARLDFGGELDPSVVVVRKPNIGYDFGSWATGIMLVPAVASARHVILTNDSLVGPFASITPLIQDFEASQADVWGLTDTRQFRHHLQSYFLGIHRGALGEKVMARFWAGVRHERSREEFILKGELGFAALLEAEGYSTDARFKTSTLVASGDNPTINGWHRLLVAGFPFVKRTLVTKPEVARNGHDVPDVVESMFGAKISEWV